MVVLSVEDCAGTAAAVAQPAWASLQFTVSDRVSLSGRGLHSGDLTCLTIHPAGEDTGIVFFAGGQTVAALASNVIDTSRGTTVASNGFRVRTIEHLMAALRGLGVDNAVVEVDGSEMPALDGSASPYVEAIESVGLAQLGAERRRVTLTEPVCVQRNGSFVLAVPASKTRITYVLNYDHPLIGSQTSTFSWNDGDFGREIAPARTFVLYEEVAALLDQQLARGGTLDNAIVIWQDRLSSDLRFPDELVRHKMMDLIGDMSLIGGVLQAEVLAVKSGHALNVEFAKEVSAAAREATGDEFLLQAVG